LFLSEDLQDGARLDGILVVNAFKVANGVDGYLVLRHGRPAARRLPAGEQPSRLTPQREAALARLLAMSWPLGVERFEREDACVERVERIGGG
jgi:hypothetical protein